MSEHAITTTSFTVVRHEDYETGHVLYVKTDGDLVKYQLALHKPKQDVLLGERKDAERVLKLLETALCCTVQEGELRE